MRKLTKGTLDRISEDSHLTQSAQRHKSVFNLFYMNAKCKDLLSIKTAVGDCSSQVIPTGEMQLELRDLHTNAPTMI